MTESSFKNLRTNLLTVLNEQGLSQSELARRIGVQQRAINRIVGNGSQEHSPTLDTIEAIAIGLGVSVSELLSEGFTATFSRKDTEPRESPKLIRQTSRLIEDFFASSDEGRKKVLKVAAECADNHLAEGLRSGA